MHWTSYLETGTSERRGSLRIWSVECWSRLVLLWTRFCSHIMKQSAVSSLSDKSTTCRESMISWSVTSSNHWIYLERKGKKLNTTGILRAYEKFVWIRKNLLLWHPLVRCHPNVYSSRRLDRCAIHDKGSSTESILTSGLPRTLVGETMSTTPLFCEEIVHGRRTLTSTSKAHMVIGSIRPKAIAFALDGGKSLNQDSQDDSWIDCKHEKVLTWPE